MLVRVLAGQVVLLIAVVCAGQGATCWQRLFGDAVRVLFLGAGQDALTGDSGC